MSTRQLLNSTLGALVLLLAAAAGVAVGTGGSGTAEQARLDVALRQQSLIQDLARQTAALDAAQDRSAAAAAREDLARSVTEFDRNLSALLQGGPAVVADGRTVVIGRTRNDPARDALEDGARLWLVAGAPLADLAAGEFSIFSAAGRHAVRGLEESRRELMRTMIDGADALRTASRSRAMIARVARWVTGGLAVLLVGLIFFRRGLLVAADRRTDAAADAGTRPATVTGESADPDGESARPRKSRRRPDSSRSRSGVDLDSVNASVAQLTVDLTTIVDRTEKMRLAITAVGHALQGMRGSLDEIVQDTTAGHRIFRSAHLAAGFSATAAGELAASTRQMAAVVARVQRLAAQTRQVAAQVDDEALHTDRAGEAFAAAIAAEVQELARRTSHATGEIEQTVNEVLATARSYEEAIGQIVKNVGAICRVSRELGEMMTTPRPDADPGALQPGARMPAPPAARSALPPEDIVAPPLPEPAAPPLPPPAPPLPAPAHATPENTQPEDPAPAPEFEDEPVAPDVTPEELAADTAAAIEDAAGRVRPRADGGSNDNIFLLKKPQKRDEPPPHGD